MLPLIDHHSVRIASPRDEVWPALLHVVTGAFSGPFATAYAKVIRCADLEPIAGFRVSSQVPPASLMLDGRHAFSTYRLAFTLAPDRDSTILTAETRATFPGPHGALYRLAVISSGGHAVAVRRMLESVRKAT